MTSVQSTRTLSEAVVERVAAAEGADPLELDPLYEAIDPDALERLFSPEGGPRPDGRIAFNYCGHTVVVDSDRSVSLSDDPPEVAAADAVLNSG